jgi:hypothetical protein
MEERTVTKSSGQADSAELAAAGEQITEVPLPVLHRDPVDVRTILSLSWLGILLTLLMLTSLGLNIYQYWRRPDRIVVDRSSGRVLMINNREYGATEVASLSPDRLTNEDKKYIAGEFVRAMYQIDPTTRSKEIEKALKMMAPKSALAFAQSLKRSGALDQERKESLQAVWTAQDISLDQADPYTVRVIGKQETTKYLEGAAVTGKRQLSLTLKLVADPRRRDDRNLRSGFLVVWLNEKELGAQGEADLSVNQ